MCTTCIPLISSKGIHVQCDVDDSAPSFCCREPLLISVNYSFSLNCLQLNLGVGYEMILENERALKLYSEAQTDLESALSMLSDKQKPPQWMDSIRNASCTSWDYPKLVWSQVRIKTVEREGERERGKGRDRGRPFSFQEILQRSH